jgi:apolipoprotein N-acyltransferase
MSDRHDWILPLTSAGLLVLAFLTPFPPANALLFVPVLAWLERSPEADARARFRGMLRFTVPAYAVGLYWVWAMLSISWLAGLMWFGLIVLFAVPNAAALAVAAWMRRAAGWSWGVVLPVCWLPVEWIRTFGDLRMTADHVAYGLAKYPFFCQFADVAGPYGVGAVVLATNGMLADVWLGRGRRRRAAIAGLVILLGAVLGYDAWAWNRWAEPAGETVRVAIVQPNVAIDTKNDLSTSVEQLRTLNRLTFEAADQGAELIVWPETARPEPMYHWPDIPGTYRLPEISPVARTLGVAMLIGSEYGRVRTEDDYDFYNAAFAVHADGTVDPVWAAKSYLVPFVEKTPLEALLGGLVRGRGGEWHWLSGGFREGPRATVLPYEFGGVGVLVCFEQLFADLPRKLTRAGAAFQVVVTNDAWWGRTRFQGYQRDVLRLRAIESRSAFVRAANTGISGFVDVRGRYRIEGALFEEAVFVDDVPLRGGLTPYARYGDVVIWFALAGLAIGVGVGRRRDAARPVEPSAGGGVVVGPAEGTDPAG